SVPIRAPRQLAAGLSIPVQEIPPHPFDPGRVLVRLALSLIIVRKLARNHQAFPTAKVRPARFFLFWEKSSGRGRKVSYSKGITTRVVFRGGPMRRSPSISREHEPVRPGRPGTWMSR